MILVKTCLIFLIPASLVPNWVDPDEFERRKAEAAISSRGLCPDRNSECGEGRKCVLISRCRNECLGVTQGLLQTDSNFKQHFQEIFCGLCDRREMICCDEDSVSNTPECAEVYEVSRETPTCGERFTNEAQISEGEDTNPGEWPWMARLIYNIPGTKNLCGGTLVSRKHVVTAAHCTESNKKPVSVILGDSDTRSDYDCLDVKSGRGCSSSGAACARDEVCAPKYVEIEIKDIVNHEKYSYIRCLRGVQAKCDQIPIFDVALIVLESLVKFSDFIQPACLPKLGEELAGPLTITGWGNTIGGTQTGTPANILQELSVREVAFQECEALWNDKLNIDLLPSHMCANTTAEFGASCKGDSGGPLVRGREVFELAGVVSFGIRTCGNVDYPLGFTKIAGEINQWLQTLVGRELPKYPK